MKTNLNPTKKITFIEARYLKAMAGNNDIKVSVAILNSCPLLHIADHEFSTFDNALAYLQRTLPQIAEVRS